MFSIEIECPPEQNDLLVAELWAEGSAGIVELEGGGLRAFFEDDADRAALAGRFHAVSWSRCWWVSDFSWCRNGSTTRRLPGASASR
jgi:hypothetical protein